MMISYCPMCGKPVYFEEKQDLIEVMMKAPLLSQEAERKRSLGKDYHPLCLKCYHCKRQLSPGQHAEYDDKPYCTHCYLQRFGPRGTRPSTSHSAIGASFSKVPAEVRKAS